MLIPLRTDRPLTRPTRTTHVILALTLLSYAAQLAVRNGNEGLNGTPFEAFMLRPDVSGFWTYVSYAFLHADFWHILGNMLILFVFGPAVEDRFGRFRFAAFYLAGAVIAGVAHALTTRSGVIGASGATAAVTGAFLVLFPRTRIRSVWFFGIIMPVMVPAWFFIGLALARDVFSIGLGSSNIAHVAHLGGYAFGAGLSFVLLWFKLIPREPYDLFSISRQAKRRRAFREAARIREPDASRVRRASSDTSRAGEDDAAPDPQAEILAEARAAVSTAIAEERMDEAVSGYRELVSRFGGERPGAATLSRNAQFKIGGELYRRGEHELADFALSRYIDAYPAERDTPEIRVLLARLKARFLGETDAAAALLDHALRVLPEGDVRDAAERELAALRSSRSGPEPA